MKRNLKTKNTIELLAIALPLMAIAGCALFSSTASVEDKSAQVQQLAYAASSFGSQAALAQHPEWRPLFEIARNDLQQIVDKKIVTGAAVRDIIAQLPVKELKNERAKIAIEGATMLFDLVVGDKMNVETNPYVHAFAVGVLAGFNASLGPATP